MLKLQQLTSNIYTSVILKTCIVSAASRRLWRSPVPVPSPLSRVRFSWLCTARPDVTRSHA